MAHKLLTALLLVSASACSTSGTEAAAPAAPVPQVAQAIEAPVFFDPVTHVRFPVPSADLKVEVEHFDPTLPPIKFKHSIQLTSENGVEALIDIWHNTEGLALQPWFDKYLSFLVDDQTQPSQRVMTRNQVPGIVLVQPESEQALSMAVAVFAHGPYVFRVTAIDYDGKALPESRAHFFHLLRALELGVDR